ncbi:MULTISPECIES: hypothetical protein [Arthrobacter]|uniref:Uncharacterized protein n=2 Tax=Arthrobacter TaxID=1663 RepID=A0ABU9KM67_9MICC|nr:hypothetical protein [Arthrobacter sp. YJM1]MDP5228120.1 hypothetical protein [Arthrobacter sp. YJM1]
MNAFEHVCEVCGRAETLTSEEAYSAGWDYPPRIGQFGVVSPRTCGECPMTSTLWWALQQGEVDPEDPLGWPEPHRKTLARILDESGAE